MERYVPKLEYIFGRRLNPIVVPPLCEMFKAAISDGIYIYLDSAYRSYAMQRDIYDKYTGKIKDMRQCREKVNIIAV